MALSDRDRRSLIILGAVAGAAVLFFLVRMLLGGGGDEQVQDAPTTQPTGVEAASPSPSATPSPRQTPPPILLVGQRDPFSVPPVLSPQPSGSPSDGGGGDGDGDGGGDGGDGDGSSTTIGGHDVSLLDIFAGGTKAQVEVDGTVYTVSEGDTFAGGDFQLVSISGDCARFLFGDEAFTLCLNPQK